MTRTIYVDRSRVECYQHCPRERFLRYHQSGVGLEPSRKPLPLAVGGSVHVGLACLLMGDNEDSAVAAAIADLGQYRNALAVDPNEQAAMTAPTNLQQQMTATASELGV